MAKLLIYLLILSSALKILLMVKNKKIEIDYIEYDSLLELPSEDKELLEKAIEAISGSYAPYSFFNVGAALRLSDGTIVKGANQENLAYPSGLCAERTAIFAAHANYPDLNIKAIAITAAKNGKVLKELVTPCGACRQVMAESQMRAGSPIKVILGSSDKVWVFSSVDGVLPFIFDSKEIRKINKKG